jgi:hypothetical protein
MLELNCRVTMLHFAKGKQYLNPPLPSSQQPSVSLPRCAVSSPPTTLADVREDGSQGTGQSARTDGTMSLVDILGTKRGKCGSGMLVNGIGRTTMRSGMVYI